MECDSSQQAMEFRLDGQDAECPEDEGRPPPANTFYHDLEREDTFNQDWTDPAVLEEDRVQASDLTHMACWMWGDPFSGVAFARLDPLRWSSVKSVGDTLLDIQDSRPSDRRRPVLLKVLRKGEPNGPWRRGEHFPDVAAATARLREAMGICSVSAGPDLSELDWARLPPSERFELRVKVASACELQMPSYKLGDFTSSILAGPGSLLRSVYAEVKLGGCRMKTKPAENTNGIDTVSFEDKGELMLFKYSGEKEMRVELKDRRNLQSIIGGDPRIGVAVLSLGHDLRDGSLRQNNLSINREGAMTGNVKLYYQLLLVQESGAVVLSN